MKFPIELPINLIGLVEVHEYNNSLLYLVSIVGPKDVLELSCEVNVRNGDFPDDDKTSDRRPILIKIE